MIWTGWAVRLTVIPLSWASAELWTSILSICGLKAATTVESFRSVKRVEYERAEGHEILKRLKDVIKRQGERIEWRLSFYSLNSLNILWWKFHADMTITKKVIRTFIVLPYLWRTLYKAVPIKIFFYQIVTRKVSKIQCFEIFVFFSFWVFVAKFKTRKLALMCELT